MKYNHIIILVILSVLLSCNNSGTQVESNEGVTPVSADVQVDHFNIWVKNPQLAKKRLVDIGFTSVPDSLSQIHKGQGTAGRYFNFFNGYLELIFVYDQEEFDENNKTNQNLDFKERAEFEKNGASPFSIALKIKDYDIAKIPFEKVQYRQDWMQGNKSIYSAKNSKENIKEPSIFVVYPEIEADVFESLNDLKNIPEEYAIWREFFKHPNGAKKVTNINITSEGINLGSETIRVVNKIENITIENGTKHFMEITFDRNIQGKSFDLRPELPLKIYM